nr:MAG TPA: hypothetical protein [Caudoviricetes sp.]
MDTSFQNLMFLFVMRFINSLPQLHCSSSAIAMQR